MGFISTSLLAQPYNFSPNHTAQGQTFTMVFTGPSSLDTNILCASPAPAVLSNSLGDTIRPTCFNNYATIIDSIHQSLERTIPLMQLQLVIIYFIQWEFKQFLGHGIF